MKAAPFQITQLTAFLATDKEGIEGIIGQLMPGTDIFMPFVCADQARVDQLRPMAQRIARENQATVRLARFTTRTDIDLIQP